MTRTSRAAAWCVAMLTFAACSSEDPASVTDAPLDPADAPMEEPDAPPDAPVDPLVGRWIDRAGTSSKTFTAEGQYEFVGASIPQRGTWSRSSPTEITRQCTEGCGSSPDANDAFVSRVVLDEDQLLFDGFQGSREVVLGAQWRLVSQRGGVGSPSCTSVEVTETITLVDSTMMSDWTNSLCQPFNIPIGSDVKSGTWMVTDHGLIATLTTGATVTYFLVEDTLGTGLWTRVAERATGQR